MTNQITGTRDFLWKDPDFLEKKRLQEIRLSHAYESGKKEERERILMFIEAHTNECGLAYCEKCVEFTSLVYFITESED
jgi:hypothetical protein